MLWLSQDLDVLPSLGAWSLCGMSEIVGPKVGGHSLSICVLDSILSVWPLPPAGTTTIAVKGTQSGAIMCPWLCPGHLPPSVL